MKTRYYIKSIISGALLGFMITGTTGCSFLDTPPTSSITASVFWKSKSDFDKALTACYAGLQSNVTAYGQPFFDGMTDNAIVDPTMSRGMNVGYFLEGGISPTLSGIVPDLYRVCCKEITRTNIFIKNMEHYKGADISVDTRTSMLGEIMFLRAYCYWVLYLYYGEVPLIKEPLTLENQYQPKAPLNEVYKAIMDDLSEAINSLPDKTYAAAKGHATKAAALALKARVLMYQASLGVSSPDLNLVQQAYDAIDAIKVYDNASLDADYAKIFQAATQEGSKEIMFSIKYKAPTNYHEWDLGVALYSGVRPTKDLWDSYETGDTRRDKTIALNGKYTWSGGTEVTLPTTNAFLVKAIRPVLTQAKIWTQTEQSDQDAVIIRWGEVMLLKAEAANELGRPASEVVSYINPVRQRSGLTDLSSSLTQEELRRHIRAERRVETCFEFMRWYDLKRWGILISKLNNNNTDPIASPGWKISYPERQFYLPLPQAEIDKSNGILKQNPAYQ